MTALFVIALLVINKQILKCTQILTQSCTIPALVPRHLPCIGNAARWLLCYFLGPSSSLAFTLSSGLILSHTPPSTMQSGTTALFQ